MQTGVTRLASEYDRLSTQVKEIASIQEETRKVVEENTHGALQT